MRKLPSALRTSTINFLRIAAALLIINSAAIAGGSPDVFAPTSGDWITDIPPFTEIVSKSSNSAVSSDGEDHWSTSARELLYTGNANATSPLSYVSFKSRYHGFFTTEHVASIDKIDSEVRYSLYGLAEITSNNNYYVKYYKNHGIDTTNYISTKGQYPFEKDSTATYWDFHQGTKTETINKSLGEVENYPDELKPYAPIIAIERDGKVVSYWSKTLRWPVMQLRASDGSVVSMVTGVTIGSKHFGETYEQADSEVSGSSVADAARQMKSAQHAAMLNQIVAGLATLAEQSAVGNSAIALGRPAPALLVPNTNAPDGGASAIALNRQIIDATLSASPPVSLLTGNTTPKNGSTITDQQLQAAQQRHEKIAENQAYLEQHRLQTTADWQKSAIATPVLNVLSDGPITGHRVARGSYRDADGRLKGDIVVWADPKNKNFASVQIGISNNTPCKMHPEIYIYIGNGSGKMPIKTLSWGDLPLAPHDKRTFGPAEIINSSGEPMTFDGSAWFDDCQVQLGQ